MMKSYWSGVGPKSKDCCPYEETERHTCEDRGGGGSDEAERQGARRMLATSRDREEVRGESPRSL